jgi:hypothetical protein
MPNNSADCEKIRFSQQQYSQFADCRCGTTCALPPIMPTVSSLTPNRNWRILALLSLVWIGFASPALAQDDAGGSLSFTAALGRLTVGQEVTVIDAAGQRTHGRLIAIRDDGFVVSPATFPYVRRFWSHPADRAFGPDVAQLSVVDSVWNGAIIGGAAAVPLLLKLTKDCDDDCDAFFGPYKVIVASVVTVLPGLLAGALIDRLINEHLYKRRSVSITFAPGATPAHLAFVGRLRF